MNDGFINEVDSNKLGEDTYYIITWYRAAADFTTFDVTRSDVYMVLVTGTRNTDGLVNKLARAGYSVHRDFLWNPAKPVSNHSPFDCEN